MANEFHNRGAFSQKVYGWLLRAYPKAHREQYGPEMAQLFRDQCRDAWSEARSWGLLKLWLRVVPDLVHSSIVERISALNERKSMTEKLASLSSSRQNSPFAAFLTVFTVVFLLVLTVSVAVTYILPESYASTARMKVTPDAGLNPGAATYDPYFIQTAFEVMESEKVLGPVINKLELNTQWGKKFNNGTPLKTWNTLEMLEKRMSLAPVRNTSLVAVTVYSDDPREAAQIANGIVESYRDYRVSSQTDLQAKGTAVLEEEYDTQGVRIQGLQTELEAMGEKLQTPAGMNKQRELDELIDGHKLLFAKIGEVRLAARMPKPLTVEIVDQAEPGRSPVKPNKTVNIALGAVAGILLASVAGGVALVIALWSKKRKAGMTVAG